MEAESGVGTYNYKAWASNGFVSQPFFSLDVTSWRCAQAAEFSGGAVDLTVEHGFVTDDTEERIAARE